MKVKVKELEEFKTKRLKEYRTVDTNDFKPFTINKKTGEIKYNSVTVPVLAKIILNKKAKGKFFYKDYAERTNEVFDPRKGLLKYYNEEKGIFELANIHIRKMVTQFLFEDLDTLEYLQCCSFAKVVNNLDIVKKTMIPSLTEEINRQLEKLGNHWNNSFYKGFFAISFINGTLILNTESGEVEFYKGHSPQFLSSLYIPINFFDSILERDSNRLFKYLDFKLNLNNPEKQEFFRALLFDFLYTENKSHHIICLNGTNGSGKSTFKEHLLSFQSRENWVTELNLKSILSKFSVPEWFYSNSIFCNETTEKYFEDNAVFKQLISKETMAIEQKGIDIIFLKPFSKLLCIGEEPIRIKADGGTDERIMNFEWKEEHYIFGESERYNYIEYYKQIKENDETGKDALLQYLAYEKYEDFIQLLVQGFIYFYNGKYGDNRRSFKKNYEKIFHNEMENSARIQMPYIQRNEDYFQDSKLGFVQFTPFRKLTNKLEIDDVQKNDSLKKHWQMIAKKVKTFKNIMLYENEKPLTIRLENGALKTLDRRTQYLFGITLKELEYIRDLLPNDRSLIGNNTVEKYNNIKEMFFTTTEEEYTKVIEPLEKKKVIFFTKKEEVDTNGK